MAVVINTPVRPQTNSDTDPTGVASRVVPRPSSEAVTRIDVMSNQVFLAGVLGGPKRMHYSSRDKLHVVSHPAQGNQPARTYDADVYESPSVSLGIQALHQAFAAHLPLSLTPDFLWYLIVYEVAEYVRQNPGRHARIFTDTPESRQVIVVRDDSLQPGDPSGWRRSIGLVRDPLRVRISDYTMDLLLPEFSTTTEESQTALLIALMDVVSPYYGFEWATLCGIPQIRLEGHADDWRSLHFRAEQLAREFDGLSGYFSDLLPVLQTIAETAAGVTPDEGFWRSIYKHNEHSGGPAVTGWITSFFAYLQTMDGRVFKDHFDWRSGWRSAAATGWGGYSTSYFPSHISTVPFVWDFVGTRYNMALAAGVTGVDFDDDTFLTPQLGFAVFEV